MRTFSRSVLLALVLSAHGCAMRNRPGGDLTVGMPKADLKSYRPAFAVRAPQHPEAPEQQAYGYVIFSYAPSVSEGRDLTICRRLRGVLYPSSEEDEVDEADEITTYWPTTGVTPPREGTHVDPCEDLVRDYDRAFADSVIASFSPRPPWRVFLMAQAPGPFGTHAAQRVCVDLGDVEDDNTLVDLLTKWRDVMRAGPTMWLPRGRVDALQRWARQLFGSKLKWGCK